MSTATPSSSALPSRRTWCARTKSADNCTHPIRKVGCPEPTAVISQLPAELPSVFVAQMEALLSDQVDGVMGLRVGFININDMYNYAGGKGVVYAYEAYEAK
jgi:hypothetical protein